MDRKERRRKQKNAVKETFRMVNTILLVVIAIAIVAFVFIFIKSQLNSEGSGEHSIFSGLFERETETSGESEDVTETETSSEEDTSDGFHELSDGRIVYLTNGERMKDAWLEDGGEIFCFDGDGFVKTGTFEEGAFRFETAQNGAVEQITFYENYRIPSGESEDYPYAVKDNMLMAFLDPQKNLGRMVRIMYKKAAETMSHQLGGDTAPQYTVPGSLQVAGGSVYWLPRIADPDEIEAVTANKLFRMRPGDEKRQTAAENVTGFKAIEDRNGTVTVYYCSGGAMYSCREDGFAVDETDIVFTEDMEYRPEVSEDGKLYLVTEGGYRVTKASDAFHVGDYVYQLDASGEILGIAPQTSVAKDGYEYEVATDAAFGVTRSVAARRKEDVREAISGEFFGSVRNIHLSGDGDCMYAEYCDAMENSRIVRITFDGDVDIVNGFDPGNREILLCGNAGDGLAVKVIDGEEDRYEIIATEHMTPLALGMEPVEIGETIHPSEPVVPGTAGPGAVGPGVAVGPGYGPGEAGASSGMQYFAPGQPVAPGSSIGEAP